MSHQQQIRRGTEAQCNAMTPAEGEVVADTSNDELRLGDGSTAGGIRQVSAKALQNQTFCYAVAGGTANAITLTSATGAAVASLVAGLSYEFKASADNTGAATLAVDGLTATSIQKPSGSGLTTLSAGDIRSGVIYKVTYNGTVFQLVGGSGGGVTSIAAGDGLSGGTITTTGTLSINTNNSLGVGAYALLYRGSSSVANGDTVAGSAMVVTVLTRGAGGVLSALSGSSPSGTWRNVSGYAIDVNQVGLCIRIA